MMDLAIEKDDYNRNHVCMLAFLTLLYTHFYDCRPLFMVYYVLCIVASFALLFYCRNVFLSDRSLYAKAILLIIFSIFFSIIPAYSCWEQSFFHSVTWITNYLGFLLYFFLIKIKVPAKSVERILIFCAGTYIVLYFFQYFNYTTVYFGSWNELRESRGIIRIIFPGEGFLFFGIAYFFSQILQGNKRIFSILFLSLLLLVMFMQVTRQYIIATGIVLFLGLLRHSKLYIKVASVIIIIIGISIYQYSNQAMIEGMRENQEADMELKEDYIRILSSGYFLTEMAPNTFARIFGNGVPNPKSSYGAFYYDELVDAWGFYFDDDGLIGGYALFGVLFVLGYLMIAYKTFRVRLSDKNYYLKYYVVMIFVMAFSSRSVFGSGFVAPTMLVLYLIHHYSEKESDELVEDCNDGSEL